MSFGLFILFYLFASVILVFGQQSHLHGLTLSPTELLFILSAAAFISGAKPLKEEKKYLPISIVPINEYVMVQDVVPFECHHNYVGFVDALC